MKKTTHVSSDIYLEL